MQKRVFVKIQEEQLFCLFSLGKSESHFIFSQWTCTFYVFHYGTIHSPIAEEASGVLLPLLQY